MVTIKTLVQFEALVDIDVGLLRVMNRYFNNPKYVTKAITDKEDIYLYKVLAITNKSKNIVDLVLKKEFKDSADSIKDELLSSKYDDILKLAPKTSLFELFKLYDKVESISVNILCKNEQQKQYINLINPELRTITDTNIDISIYDAIYIYDIDDILTYIANIKNLELFGGKKVFVSDYRFNYQETPNNIEVIVPKIESSAALLVTTNTLTMISPYTNIELPAEGISNNTKIDNNEGK